MGLGKTMQCCATLSFIAAHGYPGPFLIVAPLSTLAHWRAELERTTTLNVLVFHGNAKSKAIIRDFELHPLSNGDPVTDVLKVNVVCTNYETMLTDFAVLGPVAWRYVIFDEGHRLKNHEAKCYGVAQRLQFEHCSILTGTPIQNNVEELWSLLHFLNPKAFNDLPAFLRRYGAIDNADIVAELQEVLRPLLLRRKKGDVEKSISAKEETIIEVEMSKTQKLYYKAFLSESAGVLVSRITGGALPSLLNLMMQLRKVCNHPFLIRDAREAVCKSIAAEEGLDAGTNRAQLAAIIKSSGKIMLVDKLLRKLRGEHKVLIFSQMVKVLDILEEYCRLSGFPMERIDGGVAKNKRQASIQRFTQDPGAFVFLLCTKAGGLGINLTAADTVIVYDSSWNPQDDIQAQARCHRIGQTRDVKVFRLVMRGTYEMEMVSRASKKFGLGLAILDGRVPHPELSAQNAHEIERMLREGVYALNDDAEIERFSRETIDQILERRAKTIAVGQEGAEEGVFSKAKFDVDTQQDSAEFWSVALPSIAPPKVEPPRRHHVSTAGMDDDDTPDPRRTRRRAPLTAAVLGAQMMLEGFRGGSAEKVLLLRCAQRRKPEEAESEVLCDMLQIPRLDDEPVWLPMGLAKLHGGTKGYKDEARLVTRCVFLHQVRQALAAAQPPQVAWPIALGISPLVDYALLWGLEQNGVGPAKRVFEGTGVEAPEGWEQKTVQKRARALIAALVKPPRKEGLPPEAPAPAEWREAHAELFDRSFISDEEMKLMFRTLQQYGVPTDASAIGALVHLEGVNEVAIAEAVAKLTALGRRELEAEAEGEFIERLGVTAGDLQKMRANARDLALIRECVAEWDAECEIYIDSKVRYWDAAPEWWVAAHDAAMMRALAEFGLSRVATWVVDPSRPFAKHADAKALAALKRAAAEEAATGVSSRPREAGELSFLLVDRARLGRALHLAHALNPEEEEVDELEFDEIPALPYDLGPSVRIESWGSYDLLPDAAFPVGFRSQRLYASPSDPREKEWIESSIVYEGGELIFRVVTADATYDAGTASGAWEQAIAAVQRGRGELGMSRRKFTSVSGPAMFGLNAAPVVAAFRALRSQALSGE
jgi:chromodomain-helicase-DNA-binding protein 7